MAPNLHRYVFHIGNRFKKKHLLVSESYCTIAVVLFIYVSYTNIICLFQKLNEFDT